MYGYMYKMPRRDRCVFLPNTLFFLEINVQTYVEVFHFHFIPFSLSLTFNHGVFSLEIGITYIYLLLLFKLEYFSRAFKYLEPSIKVCFSKTIWFCRYTPTICLKAIINKIIIIIHWFRFYLIKNIIEIDFLRLCNRVP